MLSDVHITVDFGDKPLEQNQYEIQVHHIGVMASWRGVGMTCWRTKTICPSQGYQIYHKRDIDTIYFGIFHYEKP